MNGYIKSLLEYISGNETITSILMKSVFYIDFVDHPNATIYFFLATLFFSLYLFVDLLIQGKKRNFFSLFFTFLFLVISLIPTAVGSYIFYIETKPSISKIIPIGKPINVKKFKHSNEYYFNENNSIIIYKVNKNCLITPNSEINIYENLRGFKYFGNDEDLNCRFIKIDKNSINFD